MIVPITAGNETIVSRSQTKYSVVFFDPVHIHFSMQIHWYKGKSGNGPRTRTKIRGESLRTHFEHVYSFGGWSDSPVEEAVSSLGSEPYWQAQLPNRVHTQVGPRNSKHSSLQYQVLQSEIHSPWPNKHGVRDGQDGTRAGRCVERWLARSKIWRVPVRHVMPGWPNIPIRLHIYGIQTLGMRLVKMIVHPRTT